MQNFHKLEVWERSHKFALKIYSITEDFPKKEQYGVISQLTRAATSIPTNIVEGCYRTSKLEFKRFLEIAFSSASEVEYLLLLSKDLGYLSQNIYEEFTDEVIVIRKKLITLSKLI